jgi:hypothetical protein
MGRKYFWTILVFVGLFSVYEFFASDFGQMYLLDSRFYIPLSANGVQWKSDQNWMGDGEIEATFIGTPAYVAGLLSNKTPEGYSSWLKGPYGNDKLIPQSPFIATPVQVENDDKIYYALRDRGPEGFENSEYDLLIIDTKTNRVIWFRWNS